MNVRLVRESDARRSPPVQGPFCNGSLGYWVAADLAGRGVATRAVGHVLGECFTGHRLHRVEAATLVDNLRSQAVLRRNGFTPPSPP